MPVKKVRKIRKGPSGGKYYVSKGRKVYVGKKSKGKSRKTAGGKVRKMHKGKQGGRYYISKGKKVYPGKKKRVVRRRK